MGLLVIILLGMLAILAAAWFKPELFKHVYETYVKDWMIIIVGLAAEIWSWMQSDPAWQQLISEERLPWAIIIMGVLGILLRRINSGDKS